MHVGLTKNPLDRKMLGMKAMAVTKLALTFLPLALLTGCLGTGETTTPNCGSPEAQQKAIEVGNAQIESIFGPLVRASGGAMPKILELTEVRQLYADEKSGYRVCYAETRRNKGHGPLGYTIEWADKANGLFQISVEDADALLKEYGAKLPAKDAAIKATEPATTQQPKSPDTASPEACLKARMAEFETELKARMAAGEAIPDERIEADRADAEAHLRNLCGA